MSALRETIDRMIQDALDQESFYAEKAKVISVDETEGTCTVHLAVDDDDADDVTGVVFKNALNNAEGIFVTPTVNKYVMISWLNNEVCFVSLVQDYDKVTIKKGGISIVMDGTNVVVNGGSKTVALAPDVKTQINLSEADTNTLKTAMTAGITAAITAAGLNGGDGGAAAFTALQTAMTTWLAAALTLTIETDINAPNFKAKD